MSLLMIWALALLATLTIAVRRLITILSSRLTHPDCGGTNVQLLPETYSGVTTLGCASWTTQPTADSCPTAVPVVPSTTNSNTISGVAGNLSSSIIGTSSVGTNAITTDTSSALQASSSPAGETVVTGTVGSQTITETFVLTTISLFASLSSTVTMTTANSQSRYVSPGVQWPLQFLSRFISHVMRVMDL